MDLSTSDVFTFLVLSQNKFDRFMKRVPTHLKDKFVKIASDFKKFDENQDNVIDSDEFGST